MKIVCIMVASVDGKTTHGDDATVIHWNSAEDQVFFQNEIKTHRLIVMGRKTYEAAKPHFSHVEDRLRVILTKDPEKYQAEAITGMLEFSSENPKTLITRLEKLGYTDMLLAGGAGTNAAFFKENLVDELSLTIEPKLFGAGNPITTPIGHDIALVLSKTERLNSQGTLRLVYQVKKPTN